MISKSHSFVNEYCRTKIPKLIRTYASEASFETKPYKLHKLDQGPSTKVTVNKDDALHMFRKMSTIRRMENTCANLYKSKDIRGFCHLYAGQEAICVGVKQVMDPKDTVITAYRCHGWAYIMGLTVESIIAELTGKMTGCVRGKGGSMHIYVQNFYGGNGIVGAHIPIGTGVGLMHKYTNNGAVSIAAYGDGAANQGQVFEAFNMAKLWNLPVLYLCENNNYAMGTSTARGSANTDFYTRGDTIPGIWVDGMDVLAVREAFRFGKKHIADGKGPILLECMTYRYFGHSMSDPGTSYRTRDEIKEVRESRDPITCFKQKLVSAKLIEEKVLETIEKEVKEEVDKATKSAKQAKEIDVVELTYDIYSKNLQKKIRSVIYNKPAKHKRIGPAINFK